MRFATLFLLICAFPKNLNFTPTPTDYEEVFNQNYHTCLEASQLNATYVLEALDTHSTMVGFDENLKQFLFCFNKKHKIQDEDGNIDEDVLRKRLSPLKPEMVEAIVKNCTRKRQTPRETAYQYMLCAQNVTEGYDGDE